MFIDNETLLSDVQSLTATADSTNVIDLGSDRDIGRGEPQALFITVDTAAASTASGTYQFQLETSAVEAMTSEVIIADATIAEAALTEGSRHVIPLGITNLQYLQGHYILGGTDPTITITAVVQPMCAIATEDVTYAAGYATP